MTEFLVRRFVKDYDKTEEKDVRTAYGVLAGLVGIGCNLLLFLTKLVIGIFLGSISVLTDAFNNLSDAASSLVSFISAKLAATPADKEHPFGHGRIEYISALVVAFLILEVGLSCLKSAIEKIIHPEELSFSVVSIVVLVLSMFVKVWLSRFNRILGNRIHSTVMKATAADARNDVIVTGATVVSLLLTKFTGLQLDGYMGVIVAGFVFVVGIEIIKETVRPLIGEAADKEHYQKIKDFVEGYDGILGSHDLIVHNYGPAYSMATIHAEVPNTMHIEVAHELIDTIERDIYDEQNIILTIHMDPIEVNDEKVLQKKQWLKMVIRELEPEASMHDFRMVSAGNRTNLIFDLLIPYSYKEQQEMELLKKIMETVRKDDGNCRCIITVDRSFVADA